MTWVIDQEGLPLREATERLVELSAVVHAVRVQRADGLHDVLVEMTAAGAPARPGTLQHQASPMGAPAAEACGAQPDVDLDDLFSDVAFRPVARPRLVLLHGAPL